MLSEYQVVAFHGNMGSGKTTMIKTICSLAHCLENTVSPTFSLVNEYFSPLLKRKIYHSDLFRIETLEEALNLGIEDYIYDTESINFIEWPEIIEGLLPPDSLHVYFENESNTTRTIRIFKP
jgi:tRNA threonylcarbamoyladenosine biosynthesis protein TsaE